MPHDSQLCFRRTRITRRSLSGVLAILPRPSGYPGTSGALRVGPLDPVGDHRPVTIHDSYGMAPATPPAR
jgi:hypothetical protein